MTTTGAQYSADEGSREPTVASVWQGVAGSSITDELLGWPPDLFALTDVILEQAEVYRFVLSPPADVQWPPSRFASWRNAVQDAAREWCLWVQERDLALPELVAEEWAIVAERVASRLISWPEGCSGGCARRCSRFTRSPMRPARDWASLWTDRTDRDLLYRARGRELLARTGSLARIHSGLYGCCRRSERRRAAGPRFSRYACVHPPGLRRAWHKIPARHPRHEPGGRIRPHAAAAVAAAGP